MIRKLWATKEIYDIVIRAIDERKQSGIYRDDTLQMLLDFEDEKLVMVGVIFFFCFFRAIFSLSLTICCQFIMGLLIAGARATGTTGELCHSDATLSDDYCFFSASWLITFLSSHPEWNAKAASEINFLLEYFRAPAPTDSTTESLSSRLATIPLDVWETKTPIIDAIIRETTRVAQPHTAMRRNIGEDFYIDKKLIPAGAYVIYPFSDVHLNPDLYPDPWKFDPGRKPVTDTPFGYIGWGGGPVAL